VNCVFEPAPSNRARCRGCSLKIERGELRFGERLDNPFANGEMTVWLHVACAALKRPETFLQALADTSAEVPDRDRLEHAARHCVAHPRLARIDGAERSPSGVAKCRSCGQAIGRGSWRLRLVFYEEGRFSPGGFVHLDCRRTYFGTDDILEHVLRFSPTLSDEEREDLGRACGASGDA